MHAVFGRLTRLFDRHAKLRAAVKADAVLLIAKFNDEAYLEARDRVRGRCVDGAGSSRHWTRVKLEIARLQGVSVGLAGADLRR